MWDLEISTESDVILALGVLCLLIAVGAYLISKFRGHSDGEETTTSNLMTNFQELRAEGELSDEEFRTIKSMLAERLHAELKDNGGKG